jgi:hypothetical protein
VGRRSVRNACPPRTGAQGQTLDSGLPNDLLGSLEQCGLEITMVIAVTLSRSAGNTFHGNILTICETI